MALPQLQPPINYDDQLDAVKDFLSHFKTFEASTGDAAAEAIGDLRLDEDAVSDEYDFMDDSDAEKRQRPSRTKREPTKKYMNLLQKVADRDENHILIELDDLDTFEKALGDDSGLKLVESVQKNTKHYVDLFSEAVDAVMPKESREITFKDEQVG